ncbi:MAG: hypothetical protein WCV99_13695 [Sterolibacterium sp.]|jgi:hypothetical protein
MSKKIVAYWYETDHGPETEELASLALAVDEIVTPQPVTRASFFTDPRTITSPIAQKTLPSPMIGSLANIVVEGGAVPRQFASLERVSLLFKSQNQPCVGEADGEASLLAFSEYRAAQYCLEFFIEHAASNGGILIGKRALPGLNLFADKGDEGRARNSLDTWLAVLAMTSIRIALPRAHATSLEDLEDFREKSAPEREEYLSYLRELLFDGRSFLLSNPSLVELERWARFTSETKIIPAVTRIERSIQSHISKELPERIGMALLEKAPSFTESFSKNGATTSVFAEVALQSLSVIAPKVFATLLERNELRKAYGLGYLYKLRKHATNG